MAPKKKKTASVYKGGKETKRVKQKIDINLIEYLFTHHTL